MLSPFMFDLGQMANNIGSGKSLESWIRDAACSIRGAKAAPKYKDYPLLHELMTAKIRVHEFTL